MENFSKIEKSEDSFSMTFDSSKAKNFAKAVRIHALNMVTGARASHIGSALSIADLVAVLYASVMKYDPADPSLASRDRMILSKGHACVAVYGALAEAGFYSSELLTTYGQDHSDFMNHISHKVPGVEFSTGSLGHGLPFGVGKAMAAKVRDRHWRVFVVLSDGEMDEGSNWEALMFAAHHKLSNLVAIVDYNNLQSLDTVENTLNLDPLDEKLSSFGWRTSCVDGHCHEAVFQALSSQSDGRPHAIIAKTTKGKGVSFMEDRVEWHYKTPTPEQLAQAIQEIETDNA